MNTFLTRLFLVLGLGASSCVSYLPPSSLHHDMIQNQHLSLTDSTESSAEMVYGTLTVLESGYHHRLSPEMEDNKAKMITLGYSYTEQKQSVGLGLSYSGGHMYDKEGRAIDHQNLHLRTSYGYEFHEGDWHGQLMKVQGAVSRGYGGYQDTLALYYPERDEYNLAISDKQWLYSIGYGSRMMYSWRAEHQTALGFYFNHSTDFEKHGFRADYFHLNIDHVFKERYSLSTGAMLDARFTPRGETFYLSLGYQWRLP